MLWLELGQSLNRQIRRLQKQLTVLPFILMVVGSGTMSIITDAKLVK